MSERLYYLEQYSDETMPCAPELGAWAKWLAEADDGWPHDIPADGATFKCFSIDVLGDVRAEHIDGEWRADEPPSGTTFFYLRYGERLGWDAENSGPDIETALLEIDADESPCFLACTRDGPHLIAVYRADPPRLELAVGQA
jgi:hypothetical protein